MPRKGYSQQSLVSANPTQKHKLQKRFLNVSFEGVIYLWTNFIARLYTMTYVMKIDISHS